MKPRKKTYEQVRLILGDQLNIQHSWFKHPEPTILYVLMEIKPESEYVTHHIQKIVGIFQAMRNFAASLCIRGHEVKYFYINDKDNQHSFKENLHLVIKKFNITSGGFMEPDEYRLDVLLEEVFKGFKIPYSKVSTEHFYSVRMELSEMFQGKSVMPMEFFYRKMRKKHSVLLDGNEPFGGQWNFDKENRKKLPKDHIPPAPIIFAHNVSALMEEIDEAGLTYIGKIDPESYTLPATRNQALELLDYFLNHLLILFGTYQDAMSNSFWSLYHSRLSFALNIKLVNPKEIVDAVEKYWKSNQDRISISQTEGFIRQILGWREYMRGIYWKHMPEFEDMNFFSFSRPLPAYFWTGDTNMKCIHKAVKQSLHHGYAHHIQRLMVTGNFCLLTETDPDEVDNWYLGIYTDAFQWVEITNTRGMSQYADGGIVGTKPYVSSASYINKMSDYCSSCHYHHNKRIGKDACPFNSLYWRFIALNEDLLASNQRMSLMYRLWHNMDKTTRKELIEQADFYLNRIEEL